MVSQVVHSVRNSIRDNETTFRLADEAMVWDIGSEKTSVPYEDIEQLNLITYAADIADPENIHGQLTVRTKLGKSIKLRSHHLKGLGSYENRAETYAPFVSDLSQRVAAGNPEASFVLGGTGYRIMWLIALVLIVLVGAMLAIALIGGGLRFDLVSGCALTAFLARLAWNKFQSNKAATFDPANPPTDFLNL